MHHNWVKCTLCLSHCGCFRPGDGFQGGPDIICPHDGSAKWRVCKPPKQWTLHMNKRGSCAGKPNQRGGRSLYLNLVWQRAAAVTLGKRFGKGVSEKMPHLRHLMWSACKGRSIRVETPGNICKAEPHVGWLMWFLSILALLIWGGSRVWERATSFS